MPVHTLGAYYNSTFEAAFVGIILGVSAVGIFKLTILEISIVASIGAMMTVIDHTPKRFWKSKWREVKQHRRASSDPAYPREEVRNCELGIALVMRLREERSDK
ncbi:hypothetical protein TL16_g10165 [Triparma laevis f. inornata]|uniref:Uncharacterized protein n=1 Tax=Triparma laevis f. inornata TaxID=1714386 RepID=A0A9W7B6V0_9STRA|nr:hypothetical protein TL16_g10165 [Triparma laevis f. inornata]